MATCSRLTRPEGLAPSKSQLDGHQHGFQAGTRHQGQHPSRDAVTAGFAQQRAAQAR